MTCNFQPDLVRCNLQVRQPLAGSEASGRLRRQRAASCSPSRRMTAATKTQALLPKG